MPINVTSSAWVTLEAFTICCIVIIWVRASTAFFIFSMLRRSRCCTRISRRFLTRPPIIGTPMQITMMCPYTLRIIMSRALMETQQ